ncbi:putative late blight resistance protein homolog R1C-3 [Salvia miltiorrhiza]|uniref:putative late blight resistance protein homolog R1C-3 n=1 Tax=Salvia miltiorrhiza TaxID=226208 RepID=UPI0025AB7F43|nr:putative late blight resistance protein homolog R1C-3 [Salvia miltiorrhiza]
MTAYGAVNSLRNTIDYILHSSHFSLVESSPHILQLAYEELNPLQEILERLDSTSTGRSRKKVNGLDGRIKELIWEFEDVLESLLCQQIHSQFCADQIDEEMQERVWEFQGLLESLPSQSKSLEDEDDVDGERIRFSIDLQFLQHHVPSFIKRLKGMEEEYIYEVDNMPEDDEEDESISSRSGTKSKLIGLSDQFQQVKGKIMDSSDIMSHLYVLHGTAGIGKSALAEAIFKDPEILSRFERRAWVRIGRKSQFDEVSRGILAQMFGLTEGDHELGSYLKERLEGKKCLIVFDDVWEAQIWDSLLSLRNIVQRSVYILVTTRDTCAIPPIINYTTMLVRFLNEEESKELLCEKVFGEKDCPFQLNKAVTKIAKNCEGLPLMMVTVADTLSKSQNTDPKYWDDVAEMRNSVFTDAYNEMSKVLFPSYDYLPQYLKLPFLYMRVFPPDYDIPISKIMNMLATEKWFYNTNLRSFENYVWLCLDQLCANRSLVLFNRRSAIYGDLHCKFKTCRLLFSWRHLCRGEARKNKFYYILKNLVDGLEDDLEGQRCLCLENNILFSIKDFCSSVRLNCASSARSLLFFGPYHQYPISIGDNFKLLGKLDALNLRLYTFPTEILTLVLLKYLALTCNGELPTTISKLFNLRVLIIHPHNNIRIFGTSSYVPTQIWDMKELEHIEILGKSLIAPCHSASLKKLSTLVGMDASIFTILKLSHKVPYIRKLVVQTPYDDHHDLLSCFGCISTLESLEILKFSIIDPEIKYYDAFSSALMMLPRRLVKLHLSGMGFPWEYMNAIGSLPFLEVLKLRAYACQGPKWEAQEGSFLQLKFLLIEDSDLVQWKPKSGSFPFLMSLSMKHCYKLEEIHWVSHYAKGTIELVNCDPVAFTCAEQLQPSPNTVVEVTSSSSFDKKPITIQCKRSGAMTTQPEISYVRRGNTYSFR